MGYLIYTTISLKRIYWWAHFDKKGKDLMFHSSIVALVTPMHADGGLDKAALNTLIEFHIANNTQAIVVVGSTGESAMLTPQEKHEVIKQTVDTANGRIPIIAGTGASGTQQAITLTEMAMSLGVDACLIMTPPYVKPTQDGLYQHYHAIAQAVPIPQILYNVPGRTACDLLPETVSSLAKLSNVVAIKEACGDPKRAKAILDLCQDNLDVLSGDDPTIVEMMEYGAKGVVSVAANVAPSMLQKLCELMLAGDVASAKDLQNKLVPLFESLFLETNPIPVKWALHKMGLIGTGIRLPLTVLSSAHQVRLSKVLTDVGITNA